ncbi:hypothetical protein CHGG_00243 [Chaetomium globosum CBS 148.51]|uniref:FAD-binding domain-containing protein n=1 Tax=Chaetomium globosum (strain ATCC 6205 / CBS 148.51 / DSM 1962 / NBRC 6347 / NRRL 1970) TaxID=306901 RepID=Q2HHR1_CHAGB|nr:uncharacterized protein CHGG_00243 [Chaetomium globosum CBS 148.51]EAQ92008.1 hypothetical protein CHGG_00243 [Chaetomium globosum CBS 148.51]
MPESKRPFRVIVVGGGVVGLTASHCLQKAGIDHVVLEKRAVVAPPEGASIALYPHGSRILHQLGCFEAVEKACVPGRNWLTRYPDGKKFMDNGYFQHLQENHGSSLLVLERREFLQIMYDKLPDKSYIKTSSGVKSIKETPEGVEVTLVNGDVETGDMVIGADGVYSMVRSVMWEQANKATPGLITVQEKTSIKTQWKSLIGVTPNIPELGDRDVTVVNGTGRSLLALSQPDRAYFFFIFRVDEPFTWPKRANYTDQDAEDLAQQFADHPVSDTLLFGELWKRRTRGTLIPLEEGVLTHWHHGRIVLAGDSAHKVTPNIALGGNSGIESVAVLCNHLQRLLQEGGAAKPTAAVLDAVFAAYQAERLKRMQDILAVSSLITKVQAWDTRWHRFMATWLLPLQADRTTADQMSEIIRKGPKLEYVALEGFRKGRIPFDDEREAGRGKALEGAAAPISSLFLLLRSLGALAAFFVVWQGTRLALAANI